MTMTDNPEPSAEALRAASSAIASMDDEPLQWRIARAIDATVGKERERCEKEVWSIENKLWGGQRQLGFDDAKKMAIDAIHSGAKP